MTIENTISRIFVLTEDDDRALNKIAERMAVRTGDSRPNRSLAIRRLIAMWDEDTWIKQMADRTASHTQAA